MRRGSRIALTTIGLLILVLIFAVWIRQTIVSRRLEELVAEAGLTWPPQYHTTVIFDERNAATIYNDAFPMIEDIPYLWPAYEADQQPEDSRREAAAYESFLDKFENNETDNLAPEVDALRPWLDRNEDAIALLLEAVEIDRCRFPYDFVFEDEQHLSPMRDAARILRLAALISAADGDAPRASELSWALLRVGNHLQEDTVVISNLVRCAIFSLSYSTLNDVASIAPIPADWRKPIDDELLRYSDLNSWADLRKEKLFFLQGMHILLAWPTEMPETASPSPSPVQPSPPRLRFKLLLGVWIKPNIVKHLEFMDEFETICREPYWEAQPKLIRWEAEAAELPRFYAPASTMLEAMTRYAERVAMTQTKAVAARLGLALAVYKQQTGSYPDDLAALVPHFIGEIPLDPFTGNPFIYRTEGVGFILYSLGPNLTDDGGIYLRGKRNQIEKDDISWRVPR